MIELDTVADVRDWRAALRPSGRTVALVPTMGYLHEGHLSLLAHARTRADQTVMSVFVNPTQFGPDEDFGHYPRDLERDRSLAAQHGVDCLFVPAAGQIYPRQPTIGVSPGTLSDHLCGPRRPGHFAGVLLVVAKLLHLVEPHIAIFGRKDAQQGIIIRRMVEDLDFSVEIDLAPTVREPDGLALSSRNVFLDQADRQAAAVIPQALDAGHGAFADGDSDARAIVQAALDFLAAEPRIRVEYLEAVSPDTLAPVETVTGETLLALAAKVGGTRLIDNVVLGSGTAGDVFVER